jgi:diamine N-acetyltransferase
MELVSINRKNVWEIVKLKVKDEQSNFVAPNNYSLTEAYATIQSGYIALPFGIYHECKPIGFVMLGYSDIGDEDEPEIVKNNYCIWRFMIDEKYQGKGYGKQAMGLVMDKILTFPCGDADLCWLSYEKENIGAKALYEKFGFVENGEVWDDEVVAIRPLKDKVKQ